MATGVIERIFLTGASPVTLDDITSGANIFTNLSQAEDLAALCGFTQEEVEALVDRALGQGGFNLDRRTLLDDLRRFYDGYRFSDDQPDAVYNTDMVLYFLMHLRPPDRYPKEILDDNLRIDYDKLKSLLYTPQKVLRTGAVDTIRAALEASEVAARVRTSFPLVRAFEGDHFPSLLYHLGMFTFPPPAGDGYRLCVPNLAIRTLYLDSFAQLVADLAKTELASQALDESLKALAYHGDALRGRACGRLQRSAAAVEPAAIPKGQLQLDAGVQALQADRVAGGVGLCAGAEGGGAGAG